MFCPTKNVLDFLAKLDHSRKIISLTKLMQEMLSHLKKVGVGGRYKRYKKLLSEENETCSLFATAWTNWAIFILWNNTKAANLFVWFQQLFGLSFIPAPTLRCCHMLELDGYYKLLLLVNLCSNVPHSPIVPVIDRNAQSWYQTEHFIFILPLKTFFLERNKLGKGWTNSFEWVDVNKT